LSVGLTGAVWTGDIPVGGTVTITGSITIGDPYPAGGQVIAINDATTAPGSNCPSGSTDPRCTMTVNVVIPGLTIVKTANTSVAEPGTVIGYTVTVTDSGQTSYTGAVVTDDLTGALGDTAYDGDAAATTGSVSYSSPDLTWTGDLSPGGSATFTYSVTVDNPDTGGKLVINTVSSSAAGSTCPPGTTTTACQVTIPVLTPALTIAKTASTATAAPGQTITYTVTVTDSGQTPYAGATFTDDLSGTASDAAYNGDAAATAGSVAYAAPDLTWTGNLSPGDSATVTYSVTVHNPDTGGHVLTNIVTSTTLDNNCPSGSTDTRCTATVDVSGFTIVNTASTATTTPGGTVGYTITATNSGQAALAGATLTTDLAPVLDDATYDGDGTASAGTVALSGDGQSLTWTGNLAIGATVTITYSVTVNNPDTGDKTLTNTVRSATPGSTCPASSTNPACTATTTVLVPGLTITNTPSTSAATPGATVGYTLTIANTGQTSYTNVTVTDDLTGVLGDAGYNGDAVATGGTITYASPVLTWTGTLAPGASAIVTFSATVDNPDSGDKLMISDVASAAAGSTCPPGTTTAPCRSTVVILTPGLEIVSTADASTAVPGGTVHYTITITDIGQTPYTGATVADSLARLLDDAAYNGDAAATVGSVSYASPVLSWTGSLTPGAAVTITFSATVSNPDTGDRVLSTAITSTATGNNCPSGSTDPHCTTSIPVSIVTITNTASTSTATPGTTVTYTVTVSNSGQADITDGVFTLPLSDVLDDATYNNDAVATAGIVSFASSELTWDGDLTAGESATIRFTVTVDNPDTGNKALTDTIASTTPGSTCPASGPAPAACTAAVTVLIPGLTITTTAGSATTTPGSVVQYTTTMSDTGQTPYTGATVTDDLANVLNDAAYNGDATATIGSVTYAGHVLTWTGNLAPGDTATVTYSITVNNPDTGDKHLVTTVVSTDPGSTCPPASANPACTAIVTDLIPALTIIKTANVVSAAPGSAVDYTITVADTGQTPYTGATVTDDLTGVLSAATYNGDATATTGTVSYASPALTWTGNLAPGDTATITYSVTIKNPATGGTSLTNTVTSAAAGSSCPSGTSEGQCTVTTGVISGPLSITAPASAVLGSGPPGATIGSSLGTVQVTDGRGFGADWTTAVSSSDFTINGGGATETIPVSDANYAISGLATAIGPAAFGYVPEVGLSQNAQAVVNATNVDGNTTVTWNPVVQVAVPGGAVGGNYSATIVHSVS
jgi:large repetitive protein